MMLLDNVINEAHYLLEILWYVHSCDSAVRNHI